MLVEHRWDQERKKRETDVFPLESIISLSLIDFGQVYAKGADRLLLLLLFPFVNYRFSISSSLNYCRTDQFFLIGHLSMDVRRKQALFHHHKQTSIYIIGVSFDCLTTSIDNFFSFFPTAKSMFCSTREINILEVL